jgi:hypothetical protein
MLHLVSNDDSNPGMPAHQRAVDAVQAAIRAEGGPVRPPLFKPAPPRPAPSSDPLDHRIAEELEAIGRRLELLGARLPAIPSCSIATRPSSSRSI